MSLLFREKLTMLMPPSLFYRRRIAQETRSGEPELAVLSKLVPRGGTAIDVGSNRMRGCSAPPNPCTVPPRVCPSTNIGFTTTPQSWATTYFSMLSRPVLMSTSTMAHVTRRTRSRSRARSNKSPRGRPACLAGGHDPQPGRAALATLDSVTSMPGTPTTPIEPLRSSRSLGAHSSMLACSARSEAPYRTMLFGVPLSILGNDRSIRWGKCL